MRIVNQQEFMNYVSWPEIVGIGNGDSIVKWVKPSGYCVAMTIDTHDGRHIYLIEEEPIIGTSSHTGLDLSFNR